MITVLIVILLGIIVGKLVGGKMVVINDKVFILTSTLFVFMMGISLGINRTLFQNTLHIVMNSFVLSVVASLGSVLLISFISKLIKAKNV